MQTGTHVVGADNPFMANTNSETASNAAAGMAQGVKKPTTAALLGIFLGGIGAHKFYLGYTKEGVIMLAIWLVGLIFFAVPSLIIHIIGIIEGFIYLTNNTYSFQTTYVQGHKGWF